MSSSGNFKLPKMGVNVMNHVIKSQMIDFADEKIESAHASVDAEASLQFHSASSMNKESLVCGTVESSNTNVLVSDGSSTFTNGSSILNQSFSPLVSEPVIMEPHHHLSQKLNGAQIEKLREEIESGFGGTSLNGNSSAHLEEDFFSDFGSDVDNEGPKVNGTSIKEIDSVEEINKRDLERREVSEEVETVTLDFLLGESVRDELQTFHVETKSDEKQTANINGHKSPSPNAPISSSPRNSILNGIDTSAYIPGIKGNSMEKCTLNSVCFYIV